MSWWTDSWMGESFGYLWHYGGRTLLGGGLGGGVGLAVGLAIVGFGFWWLCVRGARQRGVGSHVANWLVWLGWLAVVPTSLALAGASWGAAGAVYAAVQDAVALERAVELALDSAAAVVDREDSQAAVESGWREGAASLLEGDERFPLEQVPERLEVLQEAAERWVSQRSRRFLEEESSEESRAGFLARHLLRRLGRLPMNTMNGLWLDPVLAELEATSVDDSGEIDGRELTLAVVRVHVQGPVARAARNSLVIQAWVLIAIAAAVVFLPLPILAVLARRSDPEKQSVGSGAK